MFTLEGIVCITLGFLFLGSIWLLITKNDVSNSSAMAVAGNAKDVATSNDKHIAELNQSQKDFAATQVDLLNRLGGRVDNLEKDSRNIQVNMPKSITVQIVDHRAQPAAAVIPRAPDAPILKPLIPTKPSRTPMLDRAGIRTRKTKEVNQ